MHTQIKISEDYIKQSSVVVVALLPKELPAKYLSKTERDYIQSAFEENDKRSFHFNKLTHQVFVELPKEKDNALHFNESLRVKAAALAKQATGLEVEKKLNLLHKTAIEELGVSGEIEPIMTLTFMSLIVIPELKITARGLFDVGENRFIALQ